MTTPIDGPPSGWRSEPRPHRQPLVALPQPSSDSSTAPCLCGIGDGEVIGRASLSEATDSDVASRSVPPRTGWCAASQRGGRVVATTARDLVTGDIWSVAIRQP